MEKEKKFELNTTAAIQIQYLLKMRKNIYLFIYLFYDMRKII